MMHRYNPDAAQLNEPPSASSGWQLDVAMQQQRGNLTANATTAAVQANALLEQHKKNLFQQGGAPAMEKLAGLGAKYSNDPAAVYQGLFGG
jgi:hypothetical protein